MSRASPPGTTQSAPDPARAASAGRWDGAAAGAAAAIAVAVALVLHGTAPPPAASPAIGTDEAFAEGPLRRAVTSRGALRWTGPRDAFRFHSLPSGPAVVEVRLPGHRTPVAVSAGGQVLGTLPAGRDHAVFDVPGGVRGPLAVSLQAVVAPGGPPGAQLGSIEVRHARGWWPLPLLLIVSFAVPALAAAAAARAAGVPRRPALAFAAALSVFQGAVLWPSGLVRSPWAFTVAVLLSGGALLAAAVARACRQRWPGAAPWAFAAMLMAAAVQLVLATSPVMVVSDVVFHANKLRQVAGGDLFPVSVTQHATPFRFPYGVGFYAVLVPFAKVGLDPARVVQYGAALSALFASVALLILLLPQGIVRAAGAVALLCLLPISFDVFSYGNLSNVFGQSLTVAFFAWWAGRTPGGWAAGGVLAALAALAHFSSFVVLVVLGTTLVAMGWRTRTLDRTRLFGLAAGLLLAGAYYASFLPLVLEQLGRLGEGGGTGKAARGLGGELWDELLWLRIRWGLPAIALGLAGLPRSVRERVDAGLVAFWAAGLAMAVLAVTTPVEVRYVYALTLPLAVAAATGAVRLAARGRAGTAVAVLLAGGQLVAGALAITEALFSRYR